MSTRHPGGVSWRTLLWLPWGAIALLVLGLWWSLYRVRTEVAHRDGCKARLTRLYKVVELYELEHGYLPDLAFFPESPPRGSDSLVNLLHTYGLEPENAVCPSAPGPVAWTGLTYVWNPSLNGKRLHEVQEPTWMVVDIQAVSPEVPPPHLGKYLVLYSDGSILETGQPPAILRR